MYWLCLLCNCAATKDCQVFPRVDNGVQEVRFELCIHIHALLHTCTQPEGGGDSCSALSTDIDEMCLRSIPYGFYNYPPRCGLGRCRGRNRGNNVKQGTLMGIILLKYQCTCPWGKLSATHETHTCSIRDRSPRHCQEVQVYEHISHPTAQHSWSDIVVRLWIGSYCDKW